ncbi:Hypothetical protein BCETI_3000123 [Brucella ceti str. Cudo]|uniref:Uncharacterized protein n=1 Tax=Brucella ceti str. Cudo TaxID=595497 RepID=C0G5V4_9HYPH|nr:Hypothetical protein BCETI_3000123 [Brucella ceti str. Cudo]
MSLRIIPRKPLRAFAGSALKIVIGSIVHKSAISEQAVHRSMPPPAHGA